MGTITFVHLGLEFRENDWVYSEAEEDNRKSFFKSLKGMWPL